MIYAFLFTYSINAFASLTGEIISVPKTTLLPVHTLDLNFQGNVYKPTEKGLFCSLNLSLRKSAGGSQTSYARGGNSPEHLLPDLEPRNVHCP